MSTDRSLGVISYDVPLHRRKDYNKIRSPMLGNSLMLTWSCRMFNWAQRDLMVAIIEGLNKDPDTGKPRSVKDRIRYSVLKFDDSDQQALDDAVKEAFATQLKQMKEVFLNGLQRVKDPEEGEYDEGSHRSVIKRSRKKLREMESLALVFALTDSYAHALAAFHKMIEAEAETLDATEETDESDEEDTEEVQITKKG